MQQGKAATITLRLTPALKAKLQRLAKDDRRSLSAFIEMLLEDAIKDAPKRTQRPR
jgi:hypothetical protein